MGNVINENGILKLVRPGGIVELYTHPIKAARIMERHPRHVVTRPDVFKFPYIVVKPESVLKPGRVFFIVPYHTIYRLLRSKGYCGQCKYIPDQYDHESMMIDDRKLITRSLNMTVLHQINDTDASFFNRIVPVGNYRNKKQSDHDVPRNQQVTQDPRNILGNGPTYASCFPSRRKGGKLVETRKDSASTKTCLKPCLRKHETNKMQSMQGPRVRFMLPDEDGNGDESWDSNFSCF